MINIVLPRADIITGIDYDYVLHILEKAGRTCYRSEPSGTHPSDFIEKLISRKHFSVLEHYCVSVKVVCDRGISHELVRHRIASYSQESTRYVNYNNVGIGFICPFYNEAYIDKWYEACEQAAKMYCQWLEEGVAPQIARSILPTCTTTTMIMSANLRSWREIFEKRTSIAATGKPHPQMIEIMDPLLDQFYEAIPCVFEDLYKKKEFILTPRKKYNTKCKCGFTAVLEISDKQLKENELMCPECHATYNPTDIITGEVNETNNTK